MILDKQFVRVEANQSHTLNFQYNHLDKFWNLELWLPPSEKRIQYGLGPSLKVFERCRLDLQIMAESKSNDNYRPYLGGFDATITFDEPGEPIKFGNETRFLWPLRKPACSRASQENYCLLNLGQNSIGFEIGMVEHTMASDTKIQESWVGPRFQRQFNKSLLFDIALVSYEVKSQLVFLNYRDMMLKFALKAEF